MNSRSTSDTKDQKSRREGCLHQIPKFWDVITRLVQVQLLCSLLMQLSYVAFPAYNFTLALWCFVCCTSEWNAKHPRLLPLHVGALSFSIITDIIWMSLWVSGHVFYDQMCGVNGVSIVSCGGASDYFPGCTTNRFALFTLIVNDLAKFSVVIILLRIHALTPSHHKRHQHHRDNEAVLTKDVSVPRAQIRQLPSVSVVSPEPGASFSSIPAEDPLESVS